jgi:hypothetical protein
MIAVMFHAAALVRFTRDFPDHDDRGAGEPINEAALADLRDRVREGLAREDWVEEYGDYLGSFKLEDFVVPDDAVEKVREFYNTPVELHFLDNVVVAAGDEIDVSPDGWLHRHAGDGTGEWHEWNDLGGEG